MKSYNEFIKEKHRLTMALPVTGNPVIHEFLFDFQKYCVKKAIELGRFALFCDTGLGKTLMQLSWADNVIRNHGKVLILAPLAVKEQTRRESEKFNIATGVDIINYDQLHNIDASKYSGVVLDESSILKSFTGKTRNLIIEAFKNTRYKLACSATPAPNDHTEIGNHSEFLNVLPRTEMLAEFFVHDMAKTQDWRLKGHAIDEFWEWVNTWSITMRNPADYGFDGSRYNLPPLNESTIWINEPPGSSASSFREAAKLRRDTIAERANSISDLVNRDKNEYALIWCDYNDEAESINRIIPGSVNVHGAMSRTKKAEAMISFAEKNTRVLITKPKIAGFGMNWQHCHKVYFAGPSHSFESRYQSIRRCWRFGQSKPVDVFTCSTVTEQSILANITKKINNHEMMGVNKHANGD